MMSNISRKNTEYEGNSEHVLEPCHKLTHQTSIPMGTTEDSSTSEKQIEQEFESSSKSGNLLISNPILYKTIF